MTEDSRSQIVHILEQHKYEEALSILDNLKDRDPSDRESQMYHLLVVRILILRWNLSRAATAKVSYSRITSKGIIRRLGAVVRVAESTKLIQSLGRMYQAAETGLANRGIKRIITAGAGFVFLITLLVFHMHERSNIAIGMPSKMVTSTFALDPTVSALDVKTYNLNKSRTAHDDGQLTPWSTKAGDENLFRVNHETGELSPAEHLKYVKEQKAALSRTDSAKVTPHPNATDVYAGRQQPGKILNIDSPRELAANENNGNKTPGKILGYYQSGRAIPIRNWPRFAAPTVQDIDRGILLNVLEFVGSWAKVELKPAGITGFVRREFLIPVKENKSNVAQRPSTMTETSDVTDLALGSASQ